MTNKENKLEIYFKFLEALYKIKAEVDHFRERSIDHFMSFTKYLISLSTGAIVLSINFFDKQKETPYFFILALILFLATIFFCLGQFYITAKRYKILEGYKRVESDKAEIEFNRVYSTADYKQTDFIQVEKEISRRIEKLKCWNNISHYVSIAQALSFITAIIILLIYYIKQISKGG